MEDQPKNKYHNGKIYAVRSNQTEKFYIGSTTQPLYKRLYEHRQDKKRNDKKIFGRVSSSDILEYDDHYIELLENFKCENKQQLEKREGELIREHKNNCVNKHIIGRTDKEWREDNKEYLQEYELNRQDKEERKEKLKQYCKDNKDKLNEMRKEYYKRDSQIKINCVCGMVINKPSVINHNKTIRHQKYIKSLSDI
jgi:hypothetical protein